MLEIRVFKEPACCEQVQAFSVSAMHHLLHLYKIWMGTDDELGFVQGVRVEVELRGSRADWLEGPKLAELCSCFSKASGPRIPAERLILEDQTVEKRCYKAFNAVKVCALF